MALHSATMTLLNAFFPPFHFFFKVFRHWLFSGSFKDTTRTKPLSVSMLSLAPSKCLLLWWFLKNVALSNSNDTNYVAIWNSRFIWRSERVMRRILFFFPVKKKYISIRTKRAIPPAFMFNQVLLHFSSFIIVKKWMFWYVNDLINYRYPRILS